MLGRKDYTQEELDRCRKAIDERLAAYRALVAAAPTDEAVAAFEPLYGNDLVLVLDRHFVHRIRSVSGKDTNPVTEVELLVEAVLDHDGTLRGNKVIKYQPDRSVLGLEIGSPVRLTIDQVERLANAFLDEIQRRFVDTA